MEKKLIINFSGSNLEFKDELLEVINSTDFFDTSHYTSYYIFGNSVEDLKNIDKIFNKISKSKKRIYMIIKNMEINSIEKLELKSEINGIITGLNDFRLITRLKEIIQMV